ncbi:MAG: dihydrofolate reductase family protein [Euryarchaeota archaeon]|nr:dihydrofolate reductase family protein [Euryarchaeota archaeon]MDE1880418.1 dihydrofolate reductase family protein [Euryarchaeota archaeon]
MRAAPPGGAAFPPMEPGTDRPYIWVNCATSLDGRLAYAGGKRARLSSPEDLVRVQELRLRVDAILVGVGTILADDPSLRVHRELLGEEPGATHDGPRSGPLRVVLDSQGRTPEGAKVLDGQQPTVLLVSERARRHFPLSVTTEAFGRDRVALRPALRWLRQKRGVRALMVEGGSEVIASFLREGLVDRLTIYFAPRVIGGRMAPPMVSGTETEGPEMEVSLRFVSADPLGEGVLLTWEPRGTTGPSGGNSPPPR